MARKQITVHRDHTVSRGGIPLGRVIKTTNDKGRIRWFAETTTGARLGTYGHKKARSAALTLSGRGTGEVRLPADFLKGRTGRPQTRASVPALRRSRTGTSANTDVWAQADEFDEYKVENGRTWVEAWRTYESDDGYRIEGRVGHEFSEVLSKSEAQERMERMEPKQMSRRPTNVPTDYNPNFFRYWEATAPNGDFIKAARTMKSALSVVKRDLRLTGTQARRLT